MLYVHFLLSSLVNPESFTYLYMVEARLAFRILVHITDTCITSLKETFIMTSFVSHIMNYYCLSLLFK